MPGSSSGVWEPNITWGFPQMGVSKNGWFILMKNPINMDDLGVPLFQETTISIHYYHLLIEHGLLENPPFSSMISQLNLHLQGGFPASHV